MSDVKSESLTAARPAGPILPAYNHAAKQPMRHVLRWMIDNIGFRWLVKLDATYGLENVPRTGPAILMINHIAFVDPIVVLGQMPRNIVPLAKKEVYEDPLWGIFPKLWDVIPVSRDGNDLYALKRALAVLKAGEIVLIAPEGTRHEALREPKAGIGYLAHKSGVPILPVAVENTDGFPTLKRARHQGPGVVVRIGRPFIVKEPLLTGRVAKPVLEQITRESMYQLASILPPPRRGDYGDLSQLRMETIEYIDPTA